MEEYKSLKIIQQSSNSLVYYLYLNRPRHLNVLSRNFFTEFPKDISSLDQETHAADWARNIQRLRRHIKFLQEATTAIEYCRKPVIAPVHGACIGGAIDIITACDIMYCSSDVFFSVKEVDLAITTDLGTLQRPPSIVRFGNAMELALTGRRFTGSGAKDLGLVSKVFNSKQALEEGVKVVAEDVGRPEE